MSGQSYGDLLTDVLTDIEEAYRLAEITPENRVAHFEDLEFFRAQALRLRDICDALDEAIAETFEPKERAILGPDVYEAKRKASRRGWDYDDLVNAVFDASFVNKATGEIEPMTKLEKLRMVFPLTTPRITALHALGIDETEYCKVEWSARKLSKVRA